MLKIQVLSICIFAYSIATSLQEHPEDHNTISGTQGDWKYIQETHSSQDPTKYLNDIIKYSKQLDGTNQYGDLFKEGANEGPKRVKITIRKKYRLNDNSKPQSIHDDQAINAATSYSKSLNTPERAADRQHLVDYLNFDKGTSLHLNENKGEKGTSDDGIQVEYEREKENSDNGIQVEYGFNHNGKQGHIESEAQKLVNAGVDRNEDSGKLPFNARPLSKTIYDMDSEILNKDGNLIHKKIVNSKPNLPIEVKSHFTNEHETESFSKPLTYSFIIPAQYIREGTEGDYAKVSTYKSDFDLFNANNDLNKETENENSGEFDTSQVEVLINKLCDRAKTNFLEFWDLASEYFGFDDKKLSNKQKVKWFLTVLSKLNEMKKVKPIEIDSSIPEAISKEKLPQEITLDEHITPQSNNDPKLNLPDSSQFQSTHDQGNITPQLSNGPKINLPYSSQVQTRHDQGNITPQLNNGPKINLPDISQVQTTHDQGSNDYQKDDNIGGDLDFNVIDSENVVPVSKSAPEEYKAEEEISIQRNAPIDTVNISSEEYVNRAKAYNEDNERKKLDSDDDLTLLNIDAVHSDELNSQTKTEASSTTPKESNEPILEIESVDKIKPAPYLEALRELKNQDQDATKDDAKALDLEDLTESNSPDSNKLKLLLKLFLKDPKNTENLKNFNILRNEFGEIDSREFEQIPDKIQTDIAANSESKTIRPRLRFKWNIHLKPEYIQAESLNDAEHLDNFGVELDEKDNDKYKILLYRLIHAPTDEAINILEDIVAKEDINPKILLKLILALKSKKQTNLKSNDNLVKMFLDVITKFKKHGISDEGLRIISLYLDKSFRENDDVNCQKRSFLEKLAKLENVYEIMLALKKQAEENDV